MPLHYALFGEHIAQSYSPIFHQQFAKQFDIDLIYQKITVTAESFVNRWQDYVAAGGRGANVTMPCKHLAYEICTKHSAIAKVSKSVNTIRIDSATEWYGDSTDGIGLIRDIVQYHGHALKNKNILLFGAGGAAAGILPALFAEQPRHIVICNRTLATAKNLSQNKSASACDFATIPQEIFDCVINTAAVLPLTALNIQLSMDALAYDIRYTPNAQDFISWAKQQGAMHTYDGYGMLLEQAAAAFQVWFNVLPNTAPLRVR